MTDCIVIGHVHLLLCCECEEFSVLLNKYNNLHLVFNWPEKNRMEERSVDHLIAGIDIAPKVQTGLRNFSALRFVANRAAGFDESFPVIFAASASMLILTTEYLMTSCWGHDFPWSSTNYWLVVDWKEKPKSNWEKIYFCPLKKFLSRKVSIFCSVEKCRGLHKCYPILVNTKNCWADEKTFEESTKNVLGCLMFALRVYRNKVDYKIIFQFDLSTVSLRESIHSLV